jgi:hypothetical protein
MTLTPASGTYLLEFTGSLGYDTNNVVVYCTVFLNGTEYSSGVLRRANVPYGKNGSSADRQVMAITGFITVPGSQAVEIRWYSSGGNMTCDQRYFTLVKVA